MLLSITLPLLVPRCFALMFRNDLLSTNLRKFATSLRGEFATQLTSSKPMYGGLYSKVGVERDCESEATCPRTQQFDPVKGCAAIPGLCIKSQHSKSVGSHKYYH